MFSKGLQCKKPLFFSARDITVSIHATTTIDFKEIDSRITHHLPWQESYPMKTMISLPDHFAEEIKVKLKTHPHITLVAGHSLYKTPDKDVIISIVETDKFIITYSYQDNLRYWDKESMQCVFWGKFPVEEILPNGDILYIDREYDNNKIKLFNLENVITHQSNLEPANRFCISEAYINTHIKPYVLITPIQQLEGYQRFRQARMLNNGNIIVALDGNWGHKDGDYSRFEIFDKNNQYVSMLYGKPEFVFKVLSDDSILYARWDTLYLIDNHSKIERKYDGHQHNIISAAMRQDKTLVSGSVDKTLRVWDLDGECLATLIGHTDSVSGIIILPNDDIVSGAEDKTIRIWDSKTFECKKIIEVSGRVMSLVMQEDSNIIAGLDKGKFERVCLFNHDLNPRRETKGYTPIKSDMENNAKTLTPLPQDFEKDVMFLDKKKTRFIIKNLDDSTPNLSTQNRS